MEHSTFMNLDCKIHYWHKKGKGNDYVLFFHGACIDHRTFEPQIEFFDDGVDLIFWDARGHGLSKMKDGVKFSFEDMISDCRKLYEVLGIKKAVIIGQSMGGNLAQEIAYRYPESIEKLVLIGCTRNTGRLTAAEKLTLKLSRLIFACYPWGILLSQSAAACGKMEHVKEYVKGCFIQQEKAAFIDIITATAGCLHEDIAFRFKQPTLLLCGTDDKTGNIKKAMKHWAEVDSNCTLLMIENAGHNANQDEPEIVNKQILRFLSM